ncbi:hypothetical protein ACA910_007899 [Epithemia clementina (nom. ined.)]
MSSRCNQDVIVAGGVVEEYDSSRQVLEVSPSSPSIGPRPFSSSRKKRRDHQQDFSQSAEPAPHVNNHDSSRPSNTTLLCTAFTSFMTFASVQLVFAFMAGSQAMKGDSAAMVVDSMTYLFNWYAEKRKIRFDQDCSANGALPPDWEGRNLSRERRKLVLRLEIIPPLISVTTLIAVTIVVLNRAIDVLVLDATRSRSEQANPNIHLMMAFSVFNLGLDFLNVFCFARAKHLLGFETSEHNHFGDEQYSPAETNGTIASDDGMNQPANGTSYVHIQQETSGGGGDDEEAAPAGYDESFVDDEGFGCSDQHSTESSGDQRANLNMCSAYTHVFADTLRSIAVILAALIAELTDVTSEEADSAAAIAVSVLILLSLIPLFQGIYQCVTELLAIRSQELSENGISDGDVDRTNNNSSNII